MENKYYTPDISEFHFGFEYEMKEENNEGLEIWTKGSPIENIGEVLRVLIKCGCIRVKYLDKEDIAEAGWKLCKDYSDQYVFQKDINDNDFFELELDKDTLELHIEIWRTLNMTGNANTIFRGQIKNKSQLKKLMQQLNINHG
jgi:hypothetical protein